MPFDIILGAVIIAIVAASYWLDRPSSLRETCNIVLESLDSE